jgi:hypothetical protein
MGGGEIKSPTFECHIDGGVKILRTDAPSWSA